jgi:putative DNA primase/helicase
MIKSVNGEISRMVDETQDALIGSGVPIFVRSDMLVEPITAERTAADNRTTLVTVFAPLNDYKLAYLLNKEAAVFARHDANRDKWIEINPPAAVTRTLLALRHWQFPEVMGIVNAPTLRPDGSVLREFGYDPATRLWCNVDFELPPIPDQPTKAQALAALKLLTDLLSGFCFVDAEVDRSVALAAIQSAVLRGAFAMAPIFAVIAHMAGTGKSFLVDLIATIITGRSCPVTTGSDSKEEMEKRLGALLLEGVPVFSLDNLSQDIEGDLLAQIVTQRPVKIRILGKTQMPECEWNGMMFATGNNIRVVGLDMLRRVLVCRLDAKVERPEPGVRIRSDPAGAGGSRCLRGRRHHHCPRLPGRRPSAARRAIGWVRPVVADRARAAGLVGGTRSGGQHRAGTGS